MWNIAERSAEGDSTVKATQQKAGWAAILIGLSDYATELLDSWGRWDILRHIPHLEWLATWWFSPIFIFIGMILIVRAREREHSTELEAAKKAPRLVGTDNRPLEASAKQWKWQWILLTIPGAFLIALACVVLMLWLYTPPNIYSTWSRYSPPVDPLAFIGFREENPLSCASTIKQTVVEQNGTMTGGQINGNTLISGSTTPRKEVGIHIDKSVQGKVPSIQGMNICVGDDWRCFLTAEDAYAKTGKTTEFDRMVETFSRVVDLRGSSLVRRGQIDAEHRCNQEYAEAVEELRANMRDEANTIAYLLSNPPICLKSY